MMSISIPPIKVDNNLAGYYHFTPEMIIKPPSCIEMRNLAKSTVMAARDIKQAHGSGVTVFRHGLPPRLGSSVVVLSKTERQVRDLADGVLRTPVVAEHDDGNAGVGHH